MRAPWIAAALSLMIFPGIALADLRAIDGDTLDLDGERIRIMGLDAPETRCRCPTECRLAAQATARMRDLMSGRGVTIERTGRDKYRRTLAIVRVRGQDVATIMIREGLARPYKGEKRKPWC